MPANAICRFPLAKQTSPQGVEEHHLQTGCSLSFFFFESSTNIYSLLATTSLFSVTYVWELMRPSMQEIDLNRGILSQCIRLGDCPSPIDGASTGIAPLSKKLSGNKCVVFVSLDRYISAHFLSLLH